uniref:Uncharacterized protein n=1 Tax=Parascaris equorum TaxID=6256 RepID=A0A914SAU4_PAREQ
MTMDSLHWVSFRYRHMLIENEKEDKKKESKEKESKKEEATSNGNSPNATILPKVQLATTEDTLTVADSIPHDAPPPTSLKKVRPLVLQE